MHRLRNLKNRGRRGAAAVEVALVAPLAFLLIIGPIVGGLGIFRYQQMATLAREGARWAACRGQSYRIQTGSAAITPSDVYQNAILPMAGTLNPSRLSYSVSWDADNTEVTVTVTYQWLPEAYWSPITLTSTAVMPIQ